MAFFKKNAHIIILFIAFVFLWAFRFFHLSDPYFWDELGVYGSGVQYMVDYGISIQPKNLPPEISRGHPLLFYALHASIIKLFGNSTSISHTFSLILSCLLLLTTYFLTKEVISKKWAASITLILAVQNIFLAQSILIVPEISIALLSTFAILLFLKQKYLLSAVVLCVSVLIKESTILIPAFFGGFLLLEWLIKKDFTYFKKSLVFVFPLLVLLGFLFVQKQQNGWYFFPYHTDIVKQDALSGYFKKLAAHSYFIFISQGRFLLLFGFMLGVYKGIVNQNRNILFIAFNTVSSLLVFSLAFYMDRYLLYIYPLIVCISIYGFVAVIKHHYLKISFASIIILCSVFSYTNRNFNYDASLAYEDLLHLQKEAIKWVCSQTKNSATLSGDYFMYTAVQNEYFGYTSKACFKKLSNKDAEQLFFAFFSEYQHFETPKEPLKVLTKNKAKVYIY